jgi:hypothetical protein
MDDYSTAARSDSADKHNLIAAGLFHMYMRMLHMNEQSCYAEPSHDLLLVGSHSQGQEWLPVCYSWIIHPPADSRGGHAEARMIRRLQFSARQRYVRHVMTNAE